MPVDRESVLTALRGCRDPEIPVNIVDLGLIYEIGIESGPKGDDVLVKMTLTSQGCPMSYSIVADARGQLLKLPGVAAARVEIVWEPGWNPGMMSEDARQQLQIAR